MEKIFLGAMLLQAWAGLRYADLQRVSFETLVITPEEVRGICWKTKTTHCCQPWVAICSGFLSVGSSNWLLIFLETWDECFSTMDNISQVDFIIPMMSDRGFDVPLQPMSYPRALSLFRYYLELPWKSSSPLEKLNPANYTLHGIKATLLSWSSQLRHQGVVTMEMCRLQGHRKPIQQSVSLYSRDDVLGQLELQRRLVSEIHRGFRPITPQHRGSQTPAVEPSTEIERYRKDWESYTWRLLHFSETTPNPNRLHHHPVHHPIQILMKMISSPSPPRLHPNP